MSLYCYIYFEIDNNFELFDDYTNIKINHKNKKIIEV